MSQRRTFGVPKGDLLRIVARTGPRHCCSQLRNTVQNHRGRADMNIHSIRDSGRALGIVFLTAVLPWCYPTTGMAVDFASPVSYHVGTLISAAVPADFIAVADFNGDGQPDIAVPNPGSGNVSVLLNNGDDTFKPARNFDVGMASPTSIEVADFNNDGTQDLAVWSIPDPAHATLSVLLGNRDGTFQAPK